MNQHVPLAPPAREPQQGRSRASYERMLTAAETLMVASGNDDFTLTDVARTGKVSIGSIYLRFDGKDELIRSVHRRVLVRIEADQQAMLADVIARSDGLDSFIHHFVEAFAELLRRHSPLLRPIMLRATVDRTTSETGKGSHDRLFAAVSAQLMTYAFAFSRHDHSRLIKSAYSVIYATIARYLGLGSSPESANEGNWEELKQDLGTMCAAFLRAPACVD